MCNGILWAQEWEWIFAKKKKNTEQEQMDISFVSHEKLASNPLIQKKILKKN